MSQRSTTIIARSVTLLVTDLRHSGVLHFRTRNKTTIILEDECVNINQSPVSINLRKFR